MRLDSELNAFISSSSSPSRRLQREGNLMEKTMEGNLTLKLLVDRESQKVLFAEAGKEVVDFLFSLLALPLGTVARLLAHEGMVGSVGRLHGSLASLDDAYLQVDFNKDTLLRPASATTTGQHALLLLGYCEQSTSPAQKEYFRCLGGAFQDASRGFTSVRNCESGNNYVTDRKGVPCPGCSRSMTTKMTYVKPQSTSTAAAWVAGDGFVKRGMTYMVMDDLAVQPMSTISCIATLSKFHVKGVSALEEQTVKLGFQEGLLLLRAAWHSETVLSDVFLKIRTTVVT